MNEASVPSGVKVCAIIGLGAVWGVVAWALSPSSPPVPGQACAACSILGERPIANAPESLSPPRFLAPTPDRVANVSQPMLLPASGRITAPVCRNTPVAAPPAVGAASRACAAAGKKPAGTKPRPPGPSQLVGQPATALTMNRVGGGQIDVLSSSAITVLEFWRQTCPHCRRTLPQMAKVAAAYAGRPVRFIGVNEDIGLPDDKVLDFARSTGVEHEIVRDPGRLASNAYRATGLPTLIIISPDGVIEATHVGERADLDQIVAGELDTLLSGGTHTSFPTVPRRS